MGTPTSRKGRLVEELKRIELEEDSNYEQMHSRQDNALLVYINDGEMTDIFCRSTKWYA